MLTELILSLFSFTNVQESHTMLDPLITFAVFPQVVSLSGVLHKESETFQNLSTLLLLKARAEAKNVLALHSNYALNEFCVSGCPSRQERGGGGGGWLGETLSFQPFYH